MRILVGPATEKRPGLHLSSQANGRQTRLKLKTAQGPSEKDMLSAKQINTWATAKVGTELWSNV